ncbi:MAG TPA: TetR/AcrR family transcriptional regulator [Jatrophihabitantaceae bacterium]|nr:TetR/AcrR family transcriptional regulator [Jatrophihabitantaceae bacterium]
MSTTLAQPARRRRAQRGSGEQLREEIIAAAKELLANAARADDVSIRAVADAVGITSPSIYLHFEDKNALLGAVVADVFADLDTAMLSAAEGLTEPLARLRAFGTTYVQFALRHPEQYRIAAMDPCPMPDVDEVLASGAFVHFNQTVIDCMDAGIFAKGEPLPITLELWSAAHGIASLMISKPFLPWGDPAVVIDRVLSGAALGRAAAGLIGEDFEPEDITSWLADQRARED